MLFGGGLLRLGRGCGSRGGFCGGLRLFGGGGCCGLLALDALLAGLALLRVRARIALAHAGSIEEAEHTVGGLRANAEPMLDALLDELHALAVLGQERIVGADLLDIAAVAGALGIG